MKKLTKILLTSSLSLLLAVVSVVTYLHAQSNDDKLSGLTLDNIEALAFNQDEKYDETSVPCTYTGDEYDYCVYTIVTTDGSYKVQMLQFCVNYWC